MAFNYNLDFTDPNASNDPQDSLLLQAMNDALNAWSTYISGTGTLIVQLRLAALGSPTTGSSYTIAQGGPTSATAGSYNSALAHYPATLSSVTELATGQHVAASDISITFNSQLLPSLATGTSFSLLAVLEHELGHGFGFSGFFSSYSKTLSSSYETPYDANVNVLSNGQAYFTGATAEQVYGGPVPLTSSVSSSNIYHVGATGTVFDPANLRNDLMYPYAVNPYASISGLDLAILRDSGVPLSPYAYALIFPNATVSVTTGSDSSVATSDPLITGSTNPGQVVGLFLNGNMVGGVTAAADGTYAFRPSGLGDGTYSVTATVIGGNGPVSAYDTLVLDTTTPVSAIYQKLLGAGPTAAELAAGRQALANGTSVAGLQANIAAGIAALQAVYAATVNRAATTLDLARNEDELANGATLAAMRSALINSGEEQAAITSLFQNTVGRAPAGGDVARVLGDLGKGASFANERGALVASTEERTEIQSVFQATVGRAASATDIARVQNELTNGGGIANDRVALATGAEASRAIQEVFQSAVGRAATDSDLSRLQGELSSGGSLAGDRAALASSAEADTAIANAYVAATGFGPTAAQLAASQVELRSTTTFAQITPDIIAQEGFNIVDTRVQSLNYGTAGIDLFVVGSDLHGQFLLNFDPTRDLIELPAAIARNFTASFANPDGSAKAFGIGSQVVYVEAAGNQPVILSSANLYTV